MTFNLAIRVRSIFYPPPGITFELQMLPSLCEMRVSRSIFGLMGVSISACRRVLHLWVSGFHILATVSRNFSSLGSISPLRNCHILSLCLCRWLMWNLCFVSNGCSWVSRFDGSVFFSRWRRSFEALDGWDDDAANRVLVLLVCENYADLLLSLVMASEYEDDGVSLFATYVSYVCCFLIFLDRRLYISYILGQGDSNCTWGFMSDKQIRDARLLNGDLFRLCLRRRME
jgi:hypothetical protein